MESDKATLKSKRNVWANGGLTENRKNKIVIKVWDLCMYRNYQYLDNRNHHRNQPTYRLKWNRTHMTESRISWWLNCRELRIHYQLRLRIAELPLKLSIWWKCACVSDKSKILCYIQLKDDILWSNYRPIRLYHDNNVLARALQV